MRDGIKFKTTELACRIEAVKSEILKLYTKGGYAEDAQRLNEQLEAIAKEDKIRVVFIGQYTAGKSTIISALTANKDIKIDSDIATSSTDDYSWNGVNLTDTPGLYTENPEHDARTIEMIKISDLLVYCVTSDLFNQYTKQDFEKWAFSVGYAGKMFLIVNKMSKEAGEYNELVDNYIVSLSRALVPHSVTEFSYSFVDAKDYKDGVDENNRELVEYSHFEDFIKRLNAFIQQKGLLGKLDTPIMVLKSSIDEISQKVIEDDANRAYSSLLSRIEKKIDQQRNQVAVDAHNIIRRGLKSITDKGYELSRMIGVEDMNYTEDDINELITTSCGNINSQLAALCERSMDQLNSEVEDVMNSGTASYFINSINSSYDGKKHLFETQDTKLSRAKFESVRNVVESITGKTISMATKEGAASAKFLIKSTEASGTQMHKIVLAVGGKFGYKFKPWQAVNIAKNIGNVAKFLGPAVSVLGLFLDVKETVDDQKKVQKVQKAQLEYRQSFMDIVSDLESQYSNELNGIVDAYTEISTQLKTSRDNVQGMIKSNDELTKRLLEIRNDLIDIQAEIF